MEKFSFKLVALIAALMMCLSAEANRWNSENRAMLASDMSSRDRGRAVLKTENVGGRVINAQGEPLPFVSVALLTADSTYIQGATSDVDGNFQIKTTEDCCILRFSYIGYRTKYVNVNGAEIGTIQMEEDQAMLREVVVKRQMPKTKLQRAQRPYLLYELVHHAAGRLKTEKRYHAGGEHQCPLEVDKPVCCLRTSRQHHHTGAYGI